MASVDYSRNEIRSAKRTESLQHAILTFPAPVLPTTAGQEGQSARAVCKKRCTDVLPIRSRGLISNEIPLRTGGRAGS